MNLRLNFHERLLIIRKRKGLTQTQLAEMAGLSLPTITALERGHGFSIKTLNKLAEALSVEPSHLLGPWGTQQ